eukprot:m51a1_g2873 hypothetical protein (562) ;mRNA; r:378977-380845
MEQCVRQGSLAELALRTVVRYFNLHAEVACPALLGRAVLARCCCTTPSMLSRLAARSTDALALSGPRWRDADLSYLTRHELAELSFEGCTRLTNASLAYVRELGRSLRSLRIEGCLKMTDLSVLSPLSKLEELVLPSLCTPDAATAGWIAGIAGLRRLDVGGVGIPGDFVARAVLPLRRLAHLSVWGSAFRPSRAGGPLDCLAGLVSLDISSTPCDAEDLLAAAALATGLTSLRAASCERVDDEAAEALAGAMPLLEELDLSYTAVGDAGVRSLSRLARLARLSLQGTRVSDVSPVLSACPQLRSLDVSCPAAGALLSESTWRALGAKAVAPLLCELSVAGRPEFDDARVRQLGASRLRGMARLDLSGTSVGDAGANALAKWARSLRVLLLCNCRDLTEPAIANALAASAKTLEELSLANCYVGPRALSRLARASPRALRRVDVRGDHAHVTQFGLPEARRFAKEWAAAVPWRRASGCLRIDFGPLASPTRIVEHVCAAALGEPTHLQCSEAGADTPAPQCREGAQAMRYTRQQLLALRCSPGSHRAVAMSFIPGVTVSQV